MYTVTTPDNDEVSFKFTISDRPTDPKNCVIVHHFGQVCFLDNLEEYIRYKGFQYPGQEWSYIKIVNGEAQEVSLESWT